VAIAAAPSRPSHARALVASSARILSATIVAVLIGVLASMAVGFRALVVRSGSMVPTIGSGDLIFTHVVHPDAVSVGDIVTFRDPTRSEELVTHRVVQTGVQGDQVSFVTRGDANTGVEEWAIDREGTVGVLTVRIPRLGRWLSFVSLPPVHVALLVGGAALLAIVLLRRVWSG
jgi:signal peptidase I